MQDSLSSDHETVLVVTTVGDIRIRDIHSKIRFHAPNPDADRWLTLDTINVSDDGSIVLVAAETAEHTYYSPPPEAGIDIMRRVPEDLTWLPEV